MMLTAVIRLHYCGVNVGGDINTQKGRLGQTQW